MENNSIHKINFTILNLILCTSLHVHCAASPTWMLAASYMPTAGMHAIVFNVSTMHPEMQFRCGLPLVMCLKVNFAYSLFCYSIGIPCFD